MDLSWLMVRTRYAAVAVQKPRFANRLDAKYTHDFQDTLCKLYLPGVERHSPLRKFPSSRRLFPLLYAPSCLPIIRTRALSAQPFTRAPFAILTTEGSTQSTMHTVDSHNGGFDPR